MITYKLTGKIRIQLLQFTACIMLRTVLVLAFFISAVSCDILEEILRMSASEFQANEPDKGYVNNCDPSESTFYMDWYPKVMVKGETVTVEGNYTFPEDFDEGEVKVHVKVGPFPVEKSFRFQCSEISEKPCKKGYTAVGKRTMTIPRDIPIPAGRKFKVEAELINSNTGDEIGCADAEIEFRDEDDSGYTTYRMDTDYSTEDSAYSTGYSDYSTGDSDTSSEVDDLDGDYDLLVDFVDALLKK